MQPNENEIELHKAHNVEQAIFLQLEEIREHQKAIDEKQIRYEERQKRYGRSLRRLNTITWGDGNGKKGSLRRMDNIESRTEEIELKIEKREKFERKLMTGVVMMVLTQITSILINLSTK